MSITLITSISGIVSLSVNYYTIVYMDLHYWGFFLAAFAGSLVSALMFVGPIFFKHKIYPIFYFKKLQIRKYLRVALPTIPHSYSSYLLNASDRIMLDLYGIPLASVGQYNFAYTIGNYADQMGAAVGTAIGPFYLNEFSLRNENGYKRAQILTVLMQVIFAVAAVLGCLWLKEIFFILSSNKELALAFPVGIMILMSYASKPMYWAVVSRLGFEEQTKYLWRLSFIGGVLNVILNIILIPLYGIYGAAFSTFIGLMYIGFAGFYLKVFIKMNTQKYYPLQWLLFFCIALGVTYFLREVSVFVKISISIGIIVVLGILLKIYLPKLKTLNSNSNSLQS